MNSTTKAFGVLALAATTLTWGGATLAANDNDVPLTLTGCVVAGEVRDTFVVTNLTVEGNALANVFFRLDSPRGLRNQIGHRVEIRGTADLSDLDKGELRVKTDEDGKTTTDISSEGKTVRVGENIGLGSAESAEVRRDVTTYGFEVKQVKRLDGDCGR